MKSALVTFGKRPFVRNVAIMATGTAAAQAVTMALSPFVTRLYGPEAFGMLGVFMAVVGIVSPIAALTYPTAIVLPKRNDDAKQLVRLSILVSLGISLCSAILLLLFHKHIVEMFHIEDISSYLYLIPFIILFSGFQQVTEQWLIRTKQFAITAKVTFIQAIVIQGSKVGIGFIHPVATVLIMLTVVGQLLKPLMMLSFFKMKPKHSEEVTNDDRNSLRKLASIHKDFPLFRAPQVFLNAVSSSLPLLMLTSFFGPAAAGFYSIGRTVLSIPSELIGKSVGDVFYPRISEAANDGENLTALIKKATLTLGAVGIVPYGIVVLIGPWLFGFVFGEAWVTAGEYARWIALWVFFMFINQPSVRALPVMSAQSFHLKFTILTLVTRVGVLAIGYYAFSNDLIAVALFGISGAILNLLLIFLTLKRSKNFSKVDG